MKTRTWMRSLWCAGALSAGASSCVVEGGGILQQYDRVVSIEGYLNLPDDEFVVEVLNYKTGEFETLASGRSASLPSIPANTISDNPDLFAFAANVQITTFDKPETFCRLSAACTVPASNSGCIPNGPAQVRVRGGAQFLVKLGGPRPVDTCMDEELHAGRSFGQAALACQTDDSPIFEYSKCASL